MKKLNKMATIVATRNCEAVISEMKEAYTNSGNEGFVNVAETFKALCSTRKDPDGAGFYIATLEKALVDFTESFDGNLPLDFSDFYQDRASALISVNDTYWSEFIKNPYGISSETIFDIIRMNGRLDSLTDAEFEDFMSYISNRDGQSNLEDYYKLRNDLLNGKE